MKNEGKPLCDIIATNIAKILRVNDWKASRLAMELNVTEGAISKKLSGVNKISLNDLSDMSNALTKMAREIGKPSISVIDIITYPDVYVKQTEGNAPSERISVTFEVDAREKEYLLRLVQNKK